MDLYVFIYYWYMAHACWAGDVGSSAAKVANSCPEVFFVFVYNSW